MSWEIPLKTNIHLHSFTNKTEHYVTQILHHNSGLPYMV